MPAVIAKIVYALAGVALAFSLVGLNRASRDVQHMSVVLPGGVPAVVWEPSPPLSFGETPSFDPPAPVVILCHGLAGDTAMTSSLARAIAKSGYAVIALDFRGHGRNRNPFEVSGDAKQLREDIDAALLFARTQPRFDGQRIALAGHSMGAFAVLAHAQQDPGVAAVVAISGMSRGRGAYAPPNALLIWATGDPAGMRKGAREYAAKLAGLEQLVGDKTYGEPERGTGVRMSEVPGVDHITVLYSPEAARRIVAWLGETLGPGAGTPETPVLDPRIPFSALGLAAVLVLGFGLPRFVAPLAPRIGLAPIARPLAHLLLLAIALVAAVLVLAGVDSLASPGPFAFVPFAIGRELFGFFALAGSFLLALGARRRAAPADGLVRRAHLAGGGDALPRALRGDRHPDARRSTTCSRRRTGCRGVSSRPRSSCPTSARRELLLRGAGRTGLWLPAVGKLVTLFVVAAGALTGLLPFVIFLGILPIALFFAFFEIVAIRIGRCMPGPWIAALFQAAFVGFALGAIFPFTG